VNVGFTIPVVKDTTVSFKLDRSLKARLVALAKSENRSLSNFIEKVLKEEIVRHESKQGRGKSG
jgi:predicted transcriptional regulator